MSSYIPIASQTLGSSASSVTFSSIPTTLNGKTLRDLVLVTSVRVVSEGTWRLNFNGITSAYFYVSMNGDGSSAFSAATSSDAYIQDLYTDTPTDRFAIYTAQIFDYAQTNKHKSVLLRGNRDNDNVSAVAGRWGNTAAITSLTVQNFGSNLQTGSTFSLYGLEG